MKGGDLDKPNKIFFMMFMMQISGKIAMVEIFFHRGRKLWFNAECRLVSAL